MRLAEGRQRRLIRQQPQQPQRGLGADELAPMLPKVLSAVQRGLHVSLIYKMDIVFPHIYKT